MPASSAQSLPQSLSIESTHDYPVPAAAADTPEHPQTGTISVPLMLGEERSATLESLPETLNRSMPVNPTLNDTPFPTPRAATNPSQGHVRTDVSNLITPGPILRFFGYGPNNKARKELVSFIRVLVVNFSQIVAIITLLTISTHNKSPTVPNLNEWDACDKPLGVCDAIYVAHLSLNFWLYIRLWSRERTERLQDESTGQGNNDEEAQPRTHPSPPPGGGSHGVTAQRNDNNPSEGPSQATPTSYPFCAGSQALSFIFTFVWFVLAQTFVYGSTSTCRHSSPHLWWLTFGVLSVLYLTILDVVIFYAWITLCLLWIVLLLALGRHPSQIPHHFTPDIRQAPHSVVDKLPLVLYIPPPPDQPPKPVTIPSDLRTYPPKPPAPPRRFRFFPGKGGSKQPLTDLAWEDNWERSEYPFVQLEGHRATCVICLLDFQEPKRVSEGTLTTVEDKVDPEAQAQVENKVTAAEENEGIDEGEEEVEEVSDVTEQTTPENLQLQDAGEGAQPLRLLECGHVFHQTCVDPWLLYVSNRCPVCRRPVRESGPEETAASTGQDTRPSRRRWFRRSRRRGPA